jgi:hypothetical protein
MRLKALVACFVVAAACSEKNPGDPGPAATVEVSPASWSPTWIGARQQFTATVRDAAGNVVAAEVLWEADDGDPLREIVRVDSNGIATAVFPGSGTVRAKVNALAGAAGITVTDADIRDTLMYSVWFARTKKASVMLVDGKLVIPGDLYGSGSSPADPLVTPWKHSNVAKFQWSGHRIGVLTDVVGGAGNLWVRERASEWQVLAWGNVVDFQFSGSLIGALTSDGTLQVKDGTGPWSVLVTGGVRTWAMAAGQLIGVVLPSGEFRVKNNITGPWSVLAASGVQKFSMISGGRIGMLSESGEFRVKDGINAPWTILANSGATDFALNGDRIGVLLEDGTFQVKDGIAGAWTTLVTGGMRQFAFSGDRIAVVLPNGEFMAKDGINGPWTTLATTDVREIQLHGNMIGMLTQLGALWIKEGIQGTWRIAGPQGNTVTQYRVLVDVPYPPVRITHSEYLIKLGECDVDFGGAVCYSPPTDGVVDPVTLYGRFCGSFHPPDWGKAIGALPIDGLDALCMHHDLQKSWYPEADGVGPCIVYYGLYHSELRRDGVLLATGSAWHNGGTEWDNWQAAWGNEMTNLRDAVARYFSHTSDPDPNIGFTCTQAELIDFMQNTVAQN